MPTKREFTIGIAAGLFALIFAFQYGFEISPDGWFRGVLAKSIVEGHPYWINLKQGYAYHHEVWHHNANHEPLLPFLLAILFVVFGQAITFLNIISAFCAGFLLTPILAFSRIAFSTWSVGIASYALVLLNFRTEFAREALTGLSFPSALCLFFMYIVVVLGFFNRVTWGRIVLAALCLSGYYLARGEAFAIVIPLVAIQIIIAPVQIRGALLKTSGLSFLMVLPWAIRKWIHFGNPFFSHMSGLIYADEGNHLWYYFEDCYPSFECYISRNPVSRLIHKLLVQQIEYTWSVFQDIHQPFAAFLILPLVGLLWWSWFKVKEEPRRFAYLSLISVAIVSSAVLSQAPILDRRVALLSTWSVLLVALATVFAIARRRLSIRFSAVVVSCVAVAALYFQPESVLRYPIKAYLPLRFEIQDVPLILDPTVPALQALVKPDDVVLTPFSQAQYLNFATGVGMIEAPANLQELADLGAFLRRFNVGYTIVPLPSEFMHPNYKVVEHRVIWKIRKSDEEVEPDGQRIDRDIEPELVQRIRDGKNARRIYVESVHGNSYLAENLQGVLPGAIYSTSPLYESRELLFDAGVLITAFGTSWSFLSEADRITVERFIRNGGSVLSFGHHWIWATQSRSPIDEAPLNQIIAPLGCIVLSEAGGGEIKPASDVAQSPWFRVGKGSNFSVIHCKGPHTPLLTSSGTPVAVYGNTGYGGKFVIWGHDEPIHPERISADETGPAELVRVIDKLLVVDRAE